MILGGRKSESILHVKRLQLYNIYLSVNNIVLYRYAGLVYRNFESHKVTVTSHGDGSPILGVGERTGLAGRLLGGQ